MSKDYYKILGVEKKSTKIEIKKAFRSLAQKYHPDKKDGDEDKFKEINEAYAVLSDEKKRQQYDTYGSTDGQASGFGGADGQASAGFDFSGFNNQGGFDGAGFDFSDFFSGFKGEQVRKGRDMAVNLKISFKDSVFGTNKTFTIKKKVSCKSCSGTGAESERLKTCKYCDGKGFSFKEKRTIFGLTRIQVECSECFGDGKIPEKICKKCNGSGVVNDKVEIDIKIPAGMENDNQLRIKGKGESIQGGQNGDLYIIIEVEPDLNFKKDGYDLITDLEISISDAVLGAEKNIKVIEGNIKIKIPPATEAGSILKIKEEGVIRPDGRRGVLYLNIKINIPKRINRKEREIFEELKNLGF